MPQRFPQPILCWLAGPSRQMRYNWLRDWGRDRNNERSMLKMRILVAAALLLGLGGSALSQQPTPTDSGNQQSTTQQLPFLIKVIPHRPPTGFEPSRELAVSPVP